MPAAVRSRLHPWVGCSCVVADLPVLSVHVRASLVDLSNSLALYNSICSPLASVKPPTFHHQRQTESVKRYVHPNVVTVPLEASARAYSRLVGFVINYRHRGLVSDRNSQQSVTLHIYTSTPHIFPCPLHSEELYSPAHASDPQPRQLPSNDQSTNPFSTATEPSPQQWAKRAFTTCCRMLSSQRP